MRTRSIHSTSVVPGGSYVSFTGHMSQPTVKTPYVSRVYAPVPLVGTLASVILDEEPKLKHFGSCLHTTSRWEFPEATFTDFRKYGPVSNPQNFLEIQWSGGAILQSCLSKTGNAQTINSILSSLSEPPVSPSINWRNLSFEAMYEMTPRIKSDLQLVNDGLEWRQTAALRHFFKEWTKIGVIVQRVEADLSARYRADWRNYPLRRLARATANSHLGVSFGVMPLVRSLIEVVHQLRTLHAVLREIRRNAGKVMTRHYRRNMDLLGTWPLVSSYSNNDDFQFGFTQTSVDLYRVRRLVGAPVYHATLRYSYDLSQVDRLALAIKGPLQAIGAWNVASIIWEAIPYSFVIDWFTNLGQVVESLGHVALVPINVLDFCHSVKYKSQTVLQARLPNANNVLEVARCTHSKYERRREAPATWSSLEFRPRAGLNQLLIAGSLVVQAATGGKTSRR